MSQQSIRLALDAHGGDHGVDVTLPAALEALEQEPQLEIALVGVAEALESRLREFPHPRLEWVAADSALPPDAGPVAAIRKRDSSSIGRAIQRVADKRADACVSAGSTATLVALGVNRVTMPCLRPELDICCVTCSVMSKTCPLPSVLNWIRRCMTI